MKAATLWPPAQPWEHYDETIYVYHPPVSSSNNPLRLTIKPVLEPEQTVSEVVQDIIYKSQKFKLPDKYTITHEKDLEKNDSHLWSVVTNNSL